MQATEAVVNEIEQCKTEYEDIVSKVDSRVDRAVAVLRPAAVADFRSVLASIDWPPPLVAGSSEAGKPGKVANPLVELQPEARTRFDKSFMVLANLQATQVARKRRQLKQTPENKQSLHNTPYEPLWAADELAGPLASRAEYHFTKWVKKPDLVFALIYRLTQELMDAVEEVLQPMLDSAKLPGSRAREHWISAMVMVGANHLQAHALPSILSDLEYDTGPAAALWLHTVDETLAFDSKMQGLAARSGLFQAVDKELSGIAEKALGIRVACISVFGERADWLEIWASLELADALVKLRRVQERDDTWEVQTHGQLSRVLGVTGPQSGAFSPAEEFGAPSGAGVLTSTMSAVIDRCRTLQQADQRLAFVRTAAAPVAHEYLDYLKRRCLEAEGLTALAEEEAMVKVAVCVNAAWYCQCALQDWSEDIFFLELRMAQLHCSPQGNESLSTSRLADVEGSIFDDEIESFSKFRMDWITKLVGAITRGFEARSREYIRNKRRWQEDGGGNLLESGQGGPGSPVEAALDPSSSLVDALAVLQNQMRTLQGAFNQVDFLEFWRSLAASLDLLLFFNVVFSGAKFSEHGGQQFFGDVQALFKVFRAYCARPGSYFKNLSDAVKLLTISEEDTVTLTRAFHASAWEIEDDTETVVKDALDGLLRKHGVKKLACATAGKILNNRVFLRP